uniref:Uncharacterized protein n=1 Tax=Pseudonaja textilis TaxID=8673 RepID=A0A670YGR0_PSETE
MWAAAVAGIKKKKAVTHCVGNLWHTLNLIYPNCLSGLPVIAWEHGPFPMRVFLCLMGEQTVKSRFKQCHKIISLAKSKLFRHHINTVHKIAQSTHSAREKFPEHGLQKESKKTTCLVPVTNPDWILQNIYSSYVVGIYTLHRRGISEGI